MGQFASENKMNRPPTHCSLDMVLDGAGRHASALRTTLLGNYTTKHKEVELPEQELGKARKEGNARNGSPVSPHRRNLIRATDATLDTGAPLHTHVYAFAL